ncbi:hypothetical protein [Rhizobium sp. MHM7A]|uniref:hypothetical protein n=1 Tax=Rhizobium sp. MHM7A TaxID=2583233 RepID=UPI0011066359|nr:hypothetical protein [Rhizobium sp. MHM7A]TLX15882.1 hypothetical protein FFR93_00785 [Rhizobium sp. MHM7A]
MNIAVGANTRVISLSAFRATRTATVDPRFTPPVVDIDGWYHRDEIVKATANSPHERQQS